MHTLVDLVLITIIVCFAIDISGFIDDGLKPAIAWICSKVCKLKIRPEHIKIGKPISCSLCMTWWTLIAYLFICHQLTIANLALAALLALLSSNISGLLLTFKDYLAAFESWLQKLIMK